jgi:hypothetical protein
LICGHSQFSFLKKMKYILCAIGLAVVLWICWRISCALHWLRSHEKDLKEIHRQQRGPRMTKSTYEDLGELDDEGDA